SGHRRRLSPALAVRAPSAAALERLEPPVRPRSTRSKRPPNQSVRQPCAIVSSRKYPVTACPSSDNIPGPPDKARANSRGAQSWRGDAASGRGGMPVQPKFEMALHVRPFGENDAVHVRVAHCAVPAGLVVADHSVFFGAKRFDCLLRPEIEIIGAQTDDLTAERLERVLEKHELAHGVHVGSLAALRVPGVADLDPVDLAGDIVIPRAADDGA